MAATVASPACINNAASAGAKSRARISSAMLTRLRLRADARPRLPDG